MTESKIVEIYENQKCSSANGWIEYSKKPWAQKDNLELSCSAEEYCLPAGEWVTTL
jgi:hypothetical protein